MKNGSILCMAHVRKSHHYKFHYSFLFSALPTASAAAISGAMCHSHTADYLSINTIKPVMRGLCWASSCSFILWILWNTRDCSQQLLSFLCTRHCFLLLTGLSEENNHPNKWRPEISCAYMSSADILRKYQLSWLYQFTQLSWYMIIDDFLQSCWKHKAI